MKHKSKKRELPDWSYQNDAVHNIVSDFEQMPTGKLLLVIPTGGGKTVTALKAVTALFENGLLLDGDRVLWVTHRRALRTQVEDYLLPKKDKTYSTKELSDLERLNKALEVHITGRAAQEISEDYNKRYKLVIIDEAHHAAAASYKEFFSRDIKVLGLTATPTRTDSSELEFDKISYQVTYRELLERNVILRPEFRSIDTNATITLSGSGDLDNPTLTNRAYNTLERNTAIAEAIFRAKEAHKKVIVFAGSNDHVDDLYEVFRKKNKFEGEQYHIGYIYSDDRGGGKKNEKGINNEDYLREHKDIERSVLINCAMLTEGYDDPMIDTVVLTVPTKSILYYMQCVGRVVRMPSFVEGAPDPKTFVLECEDKYVNFVYRITNEWLFSDISPVLEPHVHNEKVLDEDDLQKVLRELLKAHDVDQKYYSLIPTGVSIEAVSLLLFKATESKSYTSWYPLFFTPDTRNLYTRAFNYLSNTMSVRGDSNPAHIFFDILQIPEDDAFFGPRTSAFVKDFHRALFLAYTEKTNGDEVNRLKYFNFHVIRNQTHWLKRWFLKLSRQIRGYLQIFRNKG